jgi:hypothetical protein
MRRFCPFCKLPVYRQENDDIFLRLAPNGFFIFEHRKAGKKYCQRPFLDARTVEEGQALIKKLGIA